MSFLISPDAGQYLFDVTFALEDTFSNDHLALPFSVRRDGGIPSTEHSIPTLRIHPDDSRRLRIDVTGHPAMRQSIWSVQQLSIEIPAGTAISLPFEQRRLDTKIEVLARLSDVIAFLNTVPGADHGQPRHLIEVEVRIRIAMDDASRRQMTIAAPLLLATVRGRRSRVLSTLRLLWRHLQSRLPQSSRTIFRRMLFLVPKKRTPTRDVSTV